MTFHEFVEAVFKTMDLNPEWRQGQTLYNVFSESFPAQADALRESDANPYYDEEKVADAWDWIGQHWPGK